MLALTVGVARAADVEKAQNRPSQRELRITIDYRTELVLGIDGAGGRIIDRRRPNSRSNRGLRLHGASLGERFFEGLVSGLRPQLVVTVDAYANLRSRRQRDIHHLMLVFRNLRLDRVLALRQGRGIQRIGIVDPHQEAVG